MTVPLSQLLNSLQDAAEKATHEWYGEDDLHELGLTPDAAPFIAAASPEVVHALYGWFKGCRSGWHTWRLRTDQVSPGLGARCYCGREEFDA